MAGSVQDAEKHKEESLTRMVPKPEAKGNEESGGKQSAVSRQRSEAEGMRKP